MKIPAGGGGGHPGDGAPGGGAKGRFETSPTTSRYSPGRKMKKTDTRKASGADPLKGVGAFCFIYEKRGGRSKNGRLSESADGRAGG